MKARRINQLYIAHFVHKKNTLLVIAFVLCIYLSYFIGIKLEFSANYDFSLLQYLINFVDIVFIMKFLFCL